MYNLNVNLAANSSGAAQNTAINNLLAVENSGTTPRTPEILNTLISMINPLDSYSGQNNSDGSGGHKHKSSYNPATANNDSSNSSGISRDDSSPTSPPSVQHTCSQLIKAGLKLSIQSKRKLSSGDTSLTGLLNKDNGSQFLDLDISTNATKKRKVATSIKGEITTGSEDEYDTSSNLLSPVLGLTPEDEERRRRRRERNKIAATKCRLKKREKTVNLVQESETLETQNIELKTQIQQLESQRRRLSDMLSMHSPACVKQTSNTYPNSPPNENNNYNPQMEYNQQSQQSQQRHHHQHSDECPNLNSPTSTNLPSISTTLSNSCMESYHNTRPDSVDISNYHHHLDAYSSIPSPYGDTKPVIIVTDNGDSYATQTTHLTDLDSPNSSYNYNNSAHCHNYDQVQNGQNSQNNYSNSGLDNGCMA